MLVVPNWEFQNFQEARGRWDSITYVIVPSQFSTGPTCLSRKREITRRMYKIGGMCHNNALFVPAAISYAIERVKSPRRGSDDRIFPERRMNGKSSGWMEGHRLFVVGDRTISRRKVGNHGNRVPMLAFQGEIYLSHRNDRVFKENFQKIVLERWFILTKYDLLSFGKSTDNNQKTRDDSI